MKKPRLLFPACDAGAAGVWVTARAIRIAATRARSSSSDPAGAGAAIGDRLVEAGIVRDATSFRAGLYISGKGRRLQAGEYRFDRAMTPMEVIDKLARGDVYVINITFPEGLTMAEMGKIFETHGVGPGSAFVMAARDPSAIKALDPAARDLEGYLFPETALLRRTDAPCGSSG
jgi:UPF0755 protein